MASDYKIQIRNCPNFIPEWEVEDYITHQIDIADIDVCDYYGYRKCEDVKACPFKQSLCDYLDTLDVRIKRIYNE